MPDPPRTQVIDLFEALKQPLEETPVSEMTKAQKWKQHADAEEAIAKHWKARSKALDAVLESFKGRWQPKLDAILDKLDPEVREELDSALVGGRIGGG